MYIHKHVSVNNISTESFPFQRESIMEAYLIENPDVLFLGIAGFDNVKIWDFQYILPGKSNTRESRIDIIARYGDEYLSIVELKTGRLNKEHLKQLEGYLAKKDQIRNQQNRWDENISKEPQWLGVLVGSSIDPDLMSKITKGYSYEDKIPIAALTINRFRGDDGNVYIITDTYFAEPKVGRDYSKYEFNGYVHRKNGLVLAVIKDYVAKHPEVTYSQLKEIFPQDLQGREVFTTEEEAKAKTDRRNFLKPEELIALKDGKVVAVSTQWGIGNIGRFIEYCTTMLGYEIKEAK